jgi:hypothetical protein
VSAERSTAETRAEVARTVRHLRMPTCAARASYRTRDDDEFSLKTKVDEFGQSGFGAVRCRESATGVISIEEQSASFWQKCVFFFSRERTEQKRYS